MGRKLTSSNISEKKLIGYQRQLSNFLKTYRAKNQLLAKDVADRLGYTPSRYGQLESETTPQKRFVSSLEFLNSIGSLMGKTIPEFLIFLEGDQNRLNKHGNLSRELFRWEKVVLEVFASVNRDLLDDFVSTASASKQGKLEKLMMLSIVASRLDNKVLDKFISLVKELGER